MRNPKIYNGPAAVLRQTRIAPNGWKMTVSIPWRGRIDAGQFVHVLCDENLTFPLLRRPFSIWDLRPGKRKTTEVDLVYSVVGTGTEVLSRKEAGERIGYMGPLGRGFSNPGRTKRAVFVAGGVGIVPFYILSKQILSRVRPPRMTLLFGARNGSMLYGIDDFPPLGVETLAATEDGSRGYPGRVTGLLEETLKETVPNEVRLYACGPEPMLEAVMAIARRRRLPCEVSMEKRMGCALGACGACVTEVRDGGDWRYSRICIEGPCYDAADLVPGRV